MSGLLSKAVFLKGSMSAATVALVLFFGGCATSRGGAAGIEEMSDDAQSIVLYVQPVGGDGAPFEVTSELLDRLCRNAATHRQYDVRCADDAQAMLPNTNEGSMQTFGGRDWLAAEAAQDPMRLSGADSDRWLVPTLTREGSVWVLTLTIRDASTSENSNEVRVESDTGVEGLYEKLEAAMGKVL